MAGGSVTITGANAEQNVITLTSDETQVLAVQIAAAINAAATGSTLTAFNFPASAPIVPAGNIGEAVVPATASGGTFDASTLESYQYVVNASTVAGGGPSITSGAAQTVLSGTGGASVTAAGNDGVIIFGGGDNAVSMGSSARTRAEIAGNTTVFGGSATNTTVFGTLGNTTLFGSSGDGAQINLSQDSNLVIEGTGTATISASTGADTIFGNTGSDVVFAAASPLTFIGGTGPNTIFGGGGTPTLFGSAGSDITFAGGPTDGGGLFVAGAGNETLDASGSSGPNVMWAGANADSLAAGSGGDTITAGTGAMTAVGGSGNDVFLFFTGHAGGADVIQDFAAGDLVGLFGYGQNGVTNQQVVNGSTVLTLTDNTTITFSGVADLNPSQIIKT